MSGNEIERCGGCRSDDTEVTRVHGCDRGDAEPLSDRDDRRVHGAEPEISVCFDEVDHPDPVCDREINKIDIVRPSAGTRLRAWAEAVLDEPSGPDHDRGGHD